MRILNIFSQVQHIFAKYDLYYINLLKVMRVQFKCVLLALFNSRVGEPTCRNNYLTEMRSRASIAEIICFFDRNSSLKV